MRAEPENVLGFLQCANRCDLELGLALLTEYEMFHELMELFKSHGCVCVCVCVCVWCTYVSM